MFIFAFIHLLKFNRTLVIENLKGASRKPCPFFFAFLKAGNEPGPQSWPVGIIATDIFIFPY